MARQRPWCLCKLLQHRQGPVNSIFLTMKPENSRGVLKSFLVWTWYAYITYKEKLLPGTEASTFIRIPMFYADQFRLIISQRESTARRIQFF